MSVQNWVSKTAEQLSDMEAGVTNIASKNYWETKVYTQVKDVISTVTHVRTAPDFSDVQSAIDDLPT